MQIEPITTNEQPTNKSRAKHWCFTINNYIDAHISMFENIKLLTTYWIYGKEVGDSGTPHLQCYIAMAKQTTLASLKKYWPTAHFEIARGTPEQASTYCKKDGNFVEYGIPPAPQGANGGAATQVNIHHDINFMTAQELEAASLAAFERAHNYNSIYLQYRQELINGGNYDETTVDTLLNQYFF